MDGQPSSDIIDEIRDIPLYRTSIEQGFFPILEKPEIARGFPDNWMTPALAKALEEGEAEFVLSTGTNHARMQIIRPPYFLLKTYYRLWSEHPDIADTWHEGCRRVSLTTLLATEHVARVNAKKRGVLPEGVPTLDARRLDERTVYLNLRLDPALWLREDVERMIGEIRTEQRAHPQGRYHLDCSGYHLAHLIRKAREWGLWADFPQPASVITAYEYTPANVRAYLERYLDCPVVDLFGSTELGYLYYSDHNGRYHPYLDRMSLELIPVAPGSHIHSLIVTSLRSPHMPLIRYRSGDCVRTIDGSTDPAKVTRFCGREKELLPTPRGLVSQGDLDDAVTTAAPSVFLYQLRTEGDDGLRLLCTTFDGAPLEAAEQVGLEKFIGELTGLPCQAEHRTHIPIGISGKYAWLKKDS
ncbi:hypothetical protein [Streptomyces albipurpureus]|uniref:Phenylacetate-CoA ligase n=1 Tax=Streptomyces albipurpureus TaxID=2897419 RepID=A0ABT0UK37_9ACTN|nr:hypothetical protein [Streptomyces sp. CWNU-1]MCM2389002.1 hypothetical protein [Streptomyces sp. CWNU-1]